MIRSSHILLTLLFAAAPYAFAQTDASTQAEVNLQTEADIRAQTTVLEAVPEAPELPERVKSGEVLEPQAHVIQGEGKIISEYRVGGRLESIKVESEGFPAYWLLGADGDNQLDDRGDRLRSAREPLPHWKILTW